MKRGILYCCNGIYTAWLSVYANVYIQEKLYALTREAPISWQPWLAPSGIVSFLLLFSIPVVMIAYGLWLMTHAGK